MPRIKRWFPVSHDINRDPELWTLRQQHGEKALACWLEILSIADRNDGEIPGELSAVSHAIAWAIRCKSTKVVMIINAISTLGWLQVNTISTTEQQHDVQRIHVTNYWKYHRSEERKPAPPRPDRTRPDLTEPPKPPKQKAAQPNGFAEFWASYPKKKSKGQAEKTWIKMKVTPELLQTILAGIKRAKQSRDWLKNSGEFIPHPSTWLNARGWEDALEVSYSTPKLVAPKVERIEPTPEEKARNEEFLRQTISGLSRKFTA